MVAVSITKERTPAELRVLARRERDGRVGARLLALANALDGMGRGAAARAAGMDRQTLRDWVHRYNAEGIEGLRDLVERRFGVGYSETGMLRLLHGLDLSWQKARPVHPEADAKAQEGFKKACPR